MNKRNEPERVPKLFKLALMSISNRYLIFKNEASSTSTIPPSFPKELVGRINYLALHHQINSANTIIELIEKDDSFGNKSTNKYSSPPYICRDDKLPNIFHICCVAVIPDLDWPTPFIKKIASFSVIGIDDNKITLVNKENDKSEAEVFKALVKCLSHDTVKAINKIIPDKLPEKEMEYPVNFYGPSL